ncbi:MAG: GIY-YIG nuclease family protein [Crocinitomicaceae bacterium]|nr:GIY-YIG nuclease family protein [Crocinitomicaceae bacterium]
MYCTRRSSISVYIGQTNDLHKRLTRHNEGMVTYTKPYIPWNLKWYCEKNSRSEAMALGDGTSCPWAFILIISSLATNRMEIEKPNYLTINFA